MASKTSVSSSFAPSSSAMAVLVKGPECNRVESELGTISVEHARCQSVDLSDTTTNYHNNSNGNSPAPPYSRPAVQVPVPVLLQSMFRGIMGETDPQGEEHELVEHPLSSSRGTVSSTTTTTANSLEGYKYEFCNDNDNTQHQREVDGNCCQAPQHDVDDYDDDDDDDDDESDVIGQATFDPLLPLNLANISFKSTQSHNNTSGNNNNNTRPPVYILGKLYDPELQYDQKRDDELSLFWFTYRCDFPEIVPYRITTDAGWGCMLRSAQMMLAQALRVHFKSRSWKSHRLTIAQRRRDTFLRSLLTWMADFPSATENAYSLHNMVAAGMSKYEILPGEWYGPGTACYVVRDLVLAHEARQVSLWKKKQQQQQQQQNNVDKKSNNSSQTSNNTTKTNNAADGRPPRVFRVYVAPQGTVYKDAIRELMTKESRAQYEHAKRKSQAAAGPKQVPEHPLATAEQDLKEEQREQQTLQNLEWDTGLLLLIPLRLGLNGINEDYTKSIAFTFSIPQSVGILGGRPRGARWFYGAVADGSKILGLDPHTVQNAPRRRTARVNGKATPVLNISEEYLRSVHTTNQEAVPLLRMDPSIALGFYCRTRQDLEQVEACMTSWRSSNPNWPEMFTFAETSPDYANGGISSMMDDLIAGDMAGSSLLDIEDQNSGDVSDEDEYVML